MATNLDIWAHSTSNKASRQLRTTRTEASMRDELYKLIYGSGREVAKGGRGVYRKIRTTGSGNTLEKVRCDCIDTTTDEQDKTPSCSFCDGVGFLWDEIWFDYYKVETGIEGHLALKEEFEEAGVITIPRVTFYTLYDLDPVIIAGQIDDRVIELRRDNEGNIIRPYERIRTYRIGSAIDFRSDNNRLEFWKLVCVSDDIQGIGLASRR